MKHNTKRFPVRRLTSAAVCLALCLALPFLTGQIPQIGSALCPMHIPVLLGGFLCGGVSECCSRHPDPAYLYSHAGPVRAKKRASESFARCGAWMCANAAGRLWPDQHSAAGEESWMNHPSHTMEPGAPAVPSSITELCCHIDDMSAFGLCGGAAVSAGCAGCVLHRHHDEKGAARCRADRPLQAGGRGTNGTGRHAGDCDDRSSRQDLPEISAAAIRPNGRDGLRACESKMRRRLRHPPGKTGIRGRGRDRAGYRPSVPAGMEGDPPANQEGLTCSSAAASEQDSRPAPLYRSKGPGRKANAVKLRTRLKGLVLNFFILRQILRALNQKCGRIFGSITEKRLT